MRPKRTKMPAAAPTAAPLASPVTFSVISALASAISSRTSSEAFSVTSWIALRELGCLVVRHASVDQPLEDAGDQEGAREGDPGDAPRAARAGSARAGARRRRRVRRTRRPRRPRRVGVRSQPGRHHVARRRGSRSAAAARSRAPGARPRRRARRASLGLGLGLLGALAGPCAPCARASPRCSSAASTASCALPVSSSARRASVSRELCAQLGAARLGARALGLRLRLAAAAAASASPRSRPRRPRLGRLPGGATARPRGRRASHSWVRWGSSSLTPADLPQRCGGKPRPRRAWSRSRPGRRCRRAGRTRPAA